jgi:hypothetical protein
MCASAEAREVSGGPASALAHMLAAVAGTGGPARAEHPTTRSQILTETFGGPRQAANKPGKLAGQHKVDPNALLRDVITYLLHEGLVCVRHRGDQEPGSSVTEGGGDATASSAGKLGLILRDPRKVQRKLCGSDQGGSPERERKLLMNNFRIFADLA